ncbi:MAG: putative membrane protein [Paraglaciecola sp.]|jgi:uncharacterized membrane protein
MSGGITLLLILLLIFLLPLMFMDVMFIALGKLGIDPALAPIIIFVMLFGSLVNIPIVRKSITKPVLHYPPNLWGLERYWPNLQQHPPERIIAVNVGGFVIPMLLVIYEIARIWGQQPSLLLPMGMAVLLNIMLCYLLAKPVPQVGVTLPVFIPGLAAAVSALLLAPDMAAPVAFCAGVLGPVVGADLLNLKQVSKTHVGMASIGGAGTFDGIVISGLLAVLLS